MEHERAARGPEGTGTPGANGDGFWFVVEVDTRVYDADGRTAIGVVRAGRRYQALGRLGDWTSVKGPGGSEGLVPTVAIRAAPTPSTYRPTHVVPPSGLDAWAAPDPSAVPIARLHPGLDVMLLGRDPTGWGRVRCSNGWECWTDARWLHAAR